MSTDIAHSVQRPIKFRNGTAIGTSNRWHQGQYCSILTPAGIVGCGIYDLKVAAEFGQAIAIARGTPAKPLVDPEDLLDAKIVEATPQAEAHGIRAGMTGREAVELMLQANSAKIPEGNQLAIQVQDLDHVTLVVKDLERSRNFYVDVLGMQEVPRPAFSFAGSWFQAGKTQIHLILEFAGSGPAGNLTPEPLRSSRSQHVAFAVDDAAACVARLKECNVPILSGPKPRPDGFIQLFVSDPDGHVVELCSPPAISCAKT